MWPRGFRQRGRIAKSEASAFEAGLAILCSLRSPPKSPVELSLSDIPSSYSATSSDQQPPVADSGLHKSLGPVMLWGLGVGYVISGEYFGWNLGLPAGGAYGLLVAFLLVTVMYVAFVFAAPSLIEDRKDLERIVAAFLIAASVLSVVAIAQRVLGVFQWRAILIQSDDYSYRSNAFFADPNNLARFLAISIALAAGLIMVTGPRRMTIYLAAPMMAICAAGIVTTASRSGWLGMLLASFLVVLMSPIRRYTKGRLTGIAFGGLFFLLVLLFMQGGANAERVKSLTSGIQLLGQREFLIKGGWEMWKDNPLVGVGSGNYQHTLVISYLWTLPWWAKTTLSHTSFISILAELGIVGVGMLTLFAIRVVVACKAAYRLYDDRYSRLMAAWCAAALVEILFQSQSEGRLLEEPFLYLIFAILVAVELGAGTRGANPVVEPVEERVTEAKQKPVGIPQAAISEPPLPAAP